MLSPKRLIDCRQVTPYIVTPYYSVILPLHNTGSAVSPGVNYDNYNIYVLNLRLLHWIKYEWNRTQNPKTEFDRSLIRYHPQFVKTELNGRMMITIDLYNGSEKIPITEDKYLPIREEFNTVIDNIIGFYPNHVPILTAKNYCSSSLYRNSKTEIPIISFDPNNKIFDYTNTVGPGTTTGIPNGMNIWVKQVLPYLKVPLIYNSYIQDDTLYVEMDRNSSYIYLYQKLSESLNTQLDKLYTQGAIVAPRSFALQWSLVPVDIDSVQIKIMTNPMIENYNDLEYRSNEEVIRELDDNNITIKDVAFFSTVTDIQDGSLALEFLEYDLNTHQNYFNSAYERSGETQLYRPNWIDRRFAPDPVVFLIGRMNRKYEPISIVLDQDNFVVRHTISESLMKFGIPAIFYGSSILIKGESLKQIQMITDIVFDSQREAEGRVLSLSIPDSNLYYKFSHYTDKAIDIFTPQFKDRKKSIYITDDPISPYIYSSTVPDNADLIQLTNGMRRLMETKKGKKLL